MRLPRHFVPRNDTKGTIYYPFIDEHVIFVFLAMTFYRFSWINLEIPQTQSESSSQLCEQ